jgi:hypothetical protein
MASSTTVAFVSKSSFMEWHSLASDSACILSLLSSECCEVVHASLRIAVSPTRHFSYSSGKRSSMYFLTCVLASSGKLPDCIYRVIAYQSLIHKDIV